MHTKTRVFETSELIRVSNYESSYLNLNMNLNLLFQKRKTLHFTHSNFLLQYTYILYNYVELLNLKLHNDELNFNFY